MKKIQFNKKYLQISLYALFVITAAIIIEKTIGNVKGLLDGTVNVFGVIMRILSPFVYGFFIAYFLNPATRVIENQIFGRIGFFNRKPKLKRMVSVLSVYILVFGALTLMFRYLVPEIVQSIKSLVAIFDPSIPGGFGIESGKNNIQNYFDVINGSLATSFTVEGFIDMIMRPVMDLLNSIPELFATVYTSALSVAQTFFNLLLGIVISFYLLYDRQMYKDIASKIIYILFKSNTGDKIIYMAKKSNKVFESFVLGKALESVIVGLIFFIVCQIIGAPYPILLTIIIGVTNMIPYFGPIIGAIPVVLIVLVTDYRLAFWIAVIILIIQQLDGMFLGPKILGDSTGLKPVGVIFGIIAGGALFGIPGMFFGVPVFAVIMTALGTLLDRKYRSKLMKNEGLPDE